MFSQLMTIVRRFGPVPPGAAPSSPVPALLQSSHLSPACRKKVPHGKARRHSRHRVRSPLRRHLRRVLGAQQRDAAPFVRRRPRRPAGGDRVVCERVGRRPRHRPPTVPVQCARRAATAHAYRRQHPFVRPLPERPACLQLRRHAAGRAPAVDPARKSLRHRRARPGLQNVRRNHPFDARRYAADGRLPGCRPSDLRSLHGHAFGSAPVLREPSHAQPRQHHPPVHDRTHRAGGPARCPPELSRGLPAPGDRLATDAQPGHDRRHGPDVGALRVCPVL